MYLFIDLNLIHQFILYLKDCFKNYLKYYLKHLYVNLKNLFTLLDHYYLLFEIVNLHYFFQF